MPYRPTAENRRLKRVIFAVTAAVEHIYGTRADGAYPIGAFYTVNVSSSSWRPMGGIWYAPRNPADIAGRNILEDIERFVISIGSGDETVLRSGRIVTWERIPTTEASQLPTPR